MAEIHEVSNSTTKPAVHGEGKNFEGVRGTSHDTHGGVVGINDWVPKDAGSGGNGGWFESSQGEGVRGWAKSPFHGGVVGVNTAKGIAVFGTSDGEGVHGETTSNAFVAGVTGLAVNEDGIGPGVLGQSNGSGPGVVGEAIRDAGVIGLHGTVHFEDGSANFPGVGSAGVMGASEGGPGLLGISWGGLAGQFYGDVRISKNLTVDGDLFLPGADCAELFAVVDQIEPGDVMVIDRDGALRRSDTSYDKRVAGVVSGAGRFRPGMMLDSRNVGPHRTCPLALIGKVYCKVDARPSPIEVGDLLTTSMTAGHAMKVADPSNAFGTVLGKALAELDTGIGLLPILVCLQ
jgi:hypothetical protein